MAASIVSLTRGKTKWSGMNIVVASSNENYATGGISLTANSLGFGKVLMAHFTAQNLAGTGLYTAVYNPTTEKIQLFWVDTTVDGAAMPEIPNATAIGATVYAGTVFGI